MQSTIELDLPVALAAAPFDTLGKTVAEVARQIGRHLCKTELEPEWVAIANYVGDAKTNVYGLRETAPWPQTDGPRERLCLSVERGRSEGWIVHIEHVRFHEKGDGNGHWGSVPLVRIKTLNRTLAWSVAAVVARLLDID